MARTIPVGELRINPRTFMSEVWDGKMWRDTVTPQMVNTATNSYTTISSNGITSSSVKTSFSAVEREMMFEFLKSNMRVAEYRDGDGKIETVELQLRLDAGYEWEPIKRTKIVRSKI